MQIVHNCRNDQAAYLTEAAENKEIEDKEIAIMFPAWTRNGRVPGPALRATEVNDSGSSSRTTARIGGRKGPYRFSSSTMRCRP